MAGQGLAGQARLGKAGLGQAWQGRHGGAGHGGAGRGMAGQARAFCIGCKQAILRDATQGAIMSKSVEKMVEMKRINIQRATIELVGIRTE